MKAENPSHNYLKTELIEKLSALSFQKAIFPLGEPEIDNLIQNLEEINPNPQPLSSQNQDILSGSWKLKNASNGTEVTRKFDSKPEWTGIKIKQVYQILNGSDIGIVTSNCAKIELPLLGDLKIQASGIWKCEEDETTALVSFDAFSFQATKPWNLPFDLPELKIPVIEALRNEAVWITSYLDAEIRVGRGRTGNLFVFQK